MNKRQLKKQRGKQFDREFAKLESGDKTCVLYRIIERNCIDCLILKEIDLAAEQIFGSGLHNQKNTK